MPFRARCCLCPSPTLSHGEGGLCLLAFGKRYWLRTVKNKVVLPSRRRGVRKSLSLWEGLGEGPVIGTFSASALSFFGGRVYR